MKHEIVHDKVFRSEVLFYVGEDVETIRKHMCDKYHVKNVDAEDFIGYRGTIFESKDKKSIMTWVIWIRKADDWKSMVHESGHLVMRILDARGVLYNGKDSEVFCYLQEFFISEFWHVMCSNPKKKRGRK